MKIMIEKKKLKGRFLILLAVFMASSLAACDSNKESSINSLSSQLQSEKQDVASTLDTNVSDKFFSQDESNILTVYFSRWGNTKYPDDVDATTSASIIIDKERFGTTEYVARMIQEMVGGDLHFIETVTSYPEDFNELRSVNHDEMEKNSLPQLKESNLDISKYETIFVGYPVWATDVPQAVLSFLNQYDLSGKTVVPFCTHDGYGAGNSYYTISTASKAKKMLDGLAIEAKDVPKAKDIIARWLNSIGISKSHAGNVQNDETAIKITIGDVVLDGVIYNTDLALEVKEQFPLTISMVGYGGREYYGGVDFYPKNLEGGKKSFENGDITYCDAHHNMAVFYAQTDNPTLSVEVIPIGKITSDLTVFNTLESRETVTFSLAE